MVWFPWAWALLGLLVSVSGGSPVALLARFPCLWLPVVPGFLAALLSLFLSVLSGLAFGFARLPVPFSFRFVVGLWPVLFSLPCFVARLLACPLACLSIVVSRLCLCALGVGFPGSGLVFVRSFACSVSLLVGWVAVLLGVCCVRSRFFVPPVPLLAGAGPPHCSSPVRAQRTNARAHATGVLVFDRRDEQHLPSLIAPAGLPMCGK